MLPTVFNPVALAVFSALLAGCGLTQSVTEQTAAATRWMFYKQVRTLHLNFEARPLVNPHGPDMQGLAVPTLVRVYQLRATSSIQQVSYAELVDGDERALGEDLLQVHPLVIKPGAGAQLSMPVDPAMQAVAVIALFREPDSGSWRLLLTRDDLDSDAARVIDVAGSGLTLRPAVRE